MSILTQRGDTLYEFGSKWPVGRGPGGHQTELRPVWRGPFNYDRMCAEYDYWRDLGKNAPNAPIGRRWWAL